MSCSCDEILTHCALELPTIPRSTPAGAGQITIEIFYAGYVVTFYWHVGERISRWIVQEILPRPMP